MQKLKALTNSNLFKQMLFAFGILSISRLVWFVANVFWLPPIGIDEYVYAHLVGLYFDIPVVALIYLPVWMWVVFGDLWRERFPNINRILFLISTMIVLIFNGIDTGYSQVTAKRSGFELFDTLGDDANRFAPYLTDNWYIILGLAAMGYLIFRWVPVRGQYPDINFRARPLRGPHFEWLRATLQCQMSEYSQRIKQNRWE